MDKSYDASIIIPTYNRSQNLSRVLTSIKNLDYPADRYEIVIVDNNSTDDTPQVAEQFKQSGLNVKYVMEKKLSFTVAREAGAAVASGDVQCYLDDDVTVDPGWLAAVMGVFGADPKVGIVAGRIDPKYEATPPAWALACQEMFNGWSLCNYSDEISDAPGACGPNYCVRTKILREVGGWPPDSIGVDSFKKPGSVERIHVGPGDWGLNLKIKKAGYKIKFVPKALVYHYIPPERMTWQWWRARHRGEGYMLTLTHQVWEPKSRLQLFGEVFKNLFKAAKLSVRYLQKIMKRDIKKHGYRLLVERELTKARVHWALVRNPQLAQILWDAALTGVTGQEISKLASILP